ncbi:MAG TPA: PLP-dependent aminotransferase family protein [Nocardioidaceae bacterium]|nr:PLP-dependent aminotransferase family protein [Nocardioidaceae bacterium]
MDRRISATRTAELLGSAADRSPAYLGISDGLRLLITDGRVAPGTRLPSERELTGALGVSRTTVTRAYADLRDRGYLASRQGSGSVTQLPTVAGSGVDNLLSPGRSAEGALDLTCAAPVAPTGIAQAYEHAVADLPAYLTGTGYFPSGVPVLRESIARWYDERGLPTKPEQVLVTSGGLAAIALVARALVRTGERVLVENPTYPNAIAAFRRSGARVLTSADWDAPAAAAYLIPDFQNPTGALLTNDERTRLAATLRRNRTVPVVDETLVELAIDDVEMPAPFASFARDTITIGSSSKAFWGGLRVGWVRAPEQRMGDLVSARLSLDLGAPLLEQLAVNYLLAERGSVLTARRAQLRESRGALVDALRTHLPDWRFDVPVGGQALWCELPLPLSSALTAAAEERGVLLAAGPSFAAEGGMERFIRVPYTAAPDVLEDAATRLADAWQMAQRRRARKRPGRSALVA